MIGSHEHDGILERLSSSNPRLLCRGVGAQVESVPGSVLSVDRFLTELGVWHLFSRNPPAFSCRDAANKRYRLGHRGIPLCDELKSFVGEFTISEGRQRYVAVHCRGDRELDFSTLGRLVGAVGEIRRLSTDELERLGMAYGLVTPFAAYQLDATLLRLPVLHVWDTDALEPVAPPGTVMTNASDHQWAVEFRPDELVQKLRALEGWEILIGKFSHSDSGILPRPRGPHHGHKIAILTGNAPESGIRLWTLMNERIRARLGARCQGDVSMPSVEVHSIPELGLTMELDERESAVRPIIQAAAERAVSGGARLLAVACHTSHFFTPELRRVCGAYGAEFVSMPEVVGEWARSSGIERIGLIGIRFVAELGRWSAYSDAMSGIELEVPDAQRLEEIDRLAFRVKKDGVNSSGITRLRDLIRTSVSSETVILALTELSLLVEHLRQKARGGKVLIDPLELYADALARKFVGPDAGL